MPIDITTEYLGLKLRSPLVPSASTLADDMDKLKKLEDAGASAVVLHSLFEEQIRRDRDELFERTEQGTESFAEALTYFPEIADGGLAPDERLEQIGKAKKALRIPIIASLNGSSLGGWTDYAKKIEEAGADALELNIYTIPTDLDEPGAKVEDTAVEIVRSVRKVVKIPLGVKCSPFYSNMANMAKRFVEAGANGLVLFNRFYQPDVDLENLDIRPKVLWSTPQAARLPLTWIGILYGRLKTDFAATSGVHTGRDALKMLMVGANVTMIASALYRHGIKHLPIMEREILEWLEKNEYESVHQLRGSLSQINCPDPSAFERAHYMRALQTPRRLKSQMHRVRVNRGGARAGLIVGLVLGLLLAAGAFAVLLWFVNGAVSTGVEGYLKKYVFDRPEASFGTVQVDLLHGRFVMTDLKLKGDHLSLTVPELQADVPLKDLVSGNGVVQSLQIKTPLLEGVFSLRGGYGETGGFKWPSWIGRLPIAEVLVTDGQLRLTNRDSDAAWGLRKIEGRFIHPVLESGGGNYRFKLEGLNDAGAPGQFSLDLTLDKFELPLTLSGEWAFRKWPMDALARFVSATSDVQVTSGRLDLKTQLICKNNWLTASHLVDISDFKVEVSPRRKQLLGLPVKQFKDMMDIPSLSFVVPMNGSIYDPQVGIASSVQQILYKILEGKMADKKDLEKMSQRGGAYFGAKIDAALRSAFRKNK